MKILTFKDVFVISCFISFVLFLTGIASIPFALQYDALTQNFIYLFSRIPIVFVVIALYFNIGKKQ